MSWAKIVALLLGGIIFVSSAVEVPKINSILSDTNIIKSTNINTVAMAKKKKKKKKKEDAPILTVTYEQAIAIENKRHEREVKTIKRFYRFNPPLREEVLHRENQFHIKRLAEINKEYNR